MTETRPDLRLPLRHVRVLDLADEVGEAAGRLLADLGAETVKVEDSASSLDAGPRFAGFALGPLVRNANKATASPDRLPELLAGADIVLATPRTLAAVDRAEHPHLVVVVTSPFGMTGPRSTWQATERTLLALSGSLSRSGRPGDTPLLPPDGLANATAAAQTAWTALVAHVQRLRTGTGQLVDLSRHEAVVTGLDPAFGVQGSAAAGRSGKIRRDRPPADSYPVYPCADGFVRLCLLAKRQWRGMFEWLGQPADFADPKYDSISARVAAGDRLDALIVELFRDARGADLVEEAARRGVPLAQVLSLGEALAADHFRSAGVVRRVEVAPGLDASLPVGCVSVDGELHGWRSSSFATSMAGDWPARGTTRGFLGNTGPHPFSGLRVLDLGVIVFGAEAGRAFADLGADVVKVESLAFPDGLRQTRGGEAINASFAWGQRSKRSLGLDLRSERGRELFLDLVRSCDVVLSNFKPGTLESLGIGYDVLSTINPGIVVLESAAFNARGPWARRLGYGPLVRAACGISSLWRYDAQDAECWDGVTVFPDHVAARVAAIAVTSVLLDREVTGRGGHVEIGQSDVVLHQLAPLAALESLAPGSLAALGNAARTPLGSVLACRGDDEWVVVEARSLDEVELLGKVIEAGDGVDVGAALHGWTADRTPDEVMETLQAAGIPAAAMRRLDELPADPQLLARGTYTTLRHPGLPDELPTEDCAAPFTDLPVPDLRPAPMVGEHTRLVLADVLGLESQDIERLLRDGTVHEGHAP